MVKRMGLAITMCLILAFGLAALGCADAKAGFVGTWSLESGSDQMLDESSVELMKSLGYDVVLVLDESGTGSIDLAGQKHDVSWDAKSASEGTFDISGASSGTLMLVEGKLVMKSADGASMTFATSG